MTTPEAAWRRSLDVHLVSTDLRHDLAQGCTVVAQ
jgi:hypothetical protein